MTQREKAARTYWEAYRKLVKTCDMMEKGKKQAENHYWNEDLEERHKEIEMMIAHASIYMVDIIDILGEPEGKK